MCCDFSHAQQTAGNMLISEDERKIVKRKVGGVAAASSSQKNPANMILRYKTDLQYENNLNLHL